MSSAERYEILNAIASGDFATVYRARDRELGRELAIKQIHQQFLRDERQLARFWQEAQLLASLQHPNIVTMYDVVRSRGWLLLELMQGSLKSAAAGEPLDLDFLRTTLVSALGALHFLHQSGVIHGDVKPGNLLVDAYGRVKLGDFGLARRAASEEGSLLKGTTKYMAPELVSQQFGPVGPASDLYSLGFTAYELLCGAQFEALFPTLASFGRDRQIAWMMWHAAPDRHLPEIPRVLQGTPDDLARVIQRLAVKDQSQRYRSAAEALADLHTARSTIPGVDAPPPNATLAAQSKRKRRVLALAAVALSVSLVAAILLLPGGKPPAAVKQGPPEPLRGSVRLLDPDARLLILEKTDGKPQELKIESRDSIYVNGKARLLRDLSPGDRLTIRTMYDEQRRAFREFHASRPEAAQGVVAEVQPERGVLRVTVSEADGKPHPLDVYVSNDAQLLLNDRPEFQKKPLRLSDLRAGDRVTVQHVGDELGTGGAERTATSIAALRVISGSGVLRNVNAPRRELTIAVGDAEDLLALPVADNCEVTVNSRRFIEEKVLKAADLRPGDKVQFAHDVKIVRVDAYRTLGNAGVVRGIDYGVRILDVQFDGQPGPSPVVVPPNCPITLAGETAKLDELRAGDLIELVHDTVDAQHPAAKSLTARRPVDPARWALIVANQQYDDLTVTKPASAAADAKALQEVFLRRYRVPEAQIAALIDESLVRLQQAIPPFLARLPGDAQLVVYLAAAAYRERDGKVYAAPKSFMLTQPAVTGLPLQWLIEQIEGCKAKEKLFLLDACHAGAGADLQLQPSSEEMLASLQGPAGMAALRTVTAVASCRTGQRGETLAEQGRGLFAVCLGQAYGGAADKNRDGRLEPTELSEYLATAMAAASSKIGKTQTALLRLPDARPPRLSEEARKAVRKLASHLRQDRVDVDAIRAESQEAEQLAGKEIEPKLIYGLILMKAKRREDAFRCFDELALERPQEATAVQAAAWLLFDRLAFDKGVQRLTELVARLPPPAKPGAGLTPRAQRLLVWTGQLREYAATAAMENRRPTPASLAALDAAVEKQGVDALQHYAQGRKLTTQRVAEYDEKLIAADDEALVAKAKIDRRQLPHYATFPYEEIMQGLLEQLER